MGGGVEGNSITQGQTVLRAILKFKHEVKGIGNFGMMPKQDYRNWKLETIQIIVNDGRVSPEIKVEEIKCVVKNDGSYPESHQDGDTPEEAWEAEFESLAASQ